MSATPLRALCAHQARAIERGDLGPPGAALVYAMGATATLVGIGMGALLARSLAQ